MEIDRLTRAALAGVASSLEAEFTGVTERTSELEAICGLLDAARADADDANSPAALLASLFDPTPSADAGAIARFRDAVQSLIEDGDVDAIIALGFLLGWRCRGIVEEADTLERLAKC